MQSILCLKIVTTVSYDSKVYLSISICLRLSKVKGITHNTYSGEKYVCILSFRIDTTTTGVELRVATFINVLTVGEWVASVANLAGAVVGAIQVPAVSVGPAVVATFSALIDVPAAYPGGVFSEPSVTGAGEASSIVGAISFNTTVCSPIEMNVVNITLIQLIAGWLVHICVTVVTIMTVSIFFAANNIVPTPVVVLVADSVAAVVIV